MYLQPPGIMEYWEICLYLYLHHVFNKIYASKNLQLEKEQWNHFHCIFVVLDDEEDECFLLYSQVALLTELNSVLSGLNFAAFGLANFTVRIDPKVLKSMLALNVFFFTMLNIISSNAFEWGRTSTSFLNIN